MLIVPRLESIAIIILSTLVDAIEVVWATDLLKNNFFLRAKDKTDNSQPWSHPNYPELFLLFKNNILSVGCTNFGPNYFCLPFAALPSAETSGFESVIATFNLQTKNQEA